MILIASFLILFANAEEKTYTEIEVKDRVCYALCRNERGYDTGMYNGTYDDCLCANKEKFSELLKIVIKVPRVMTQKKMEALYPNWGKE